MIHNDCWGTLKEGVAFPKGSRGSLRSRSWEQNIDQRESSEAKDLNLLLRQAALAESLGPNFVRIVCRTRSSSASRPISFFHYFSLSLSLSLCLLLHVPLYLYYGGSALWNALVTNLSDMYVNFCSRLKFL